MKKTDLAAFLPNLGVLSTENLGVEKSVALARDALRVGLSTNFDAGAAGERNLLWNECVIEGVEVERGTGGRGLHLVGGHGGGGETDKSHGTCDVD